MRCPRPPGPEGWHTGLVVDYVTTFGVHADASFTPYPLAELSKIVTAAIPLGEKISVYAESSGAPAPTRYIAIQERRTGPLSSIPKARFPECCSSTLPPRRFDRSRLRPAGTRP